MSNPIGIANALDMMRTEMADGFTIDGTQRQIDTLAEAIALLRSIPELTEKAWMYDDLCK